MTMPEIKHRMTDAVHYIISRTSRHELGATKLNKVLWLADQMAWRERQQSLTGLTTYKRMPNGPVPDCIEDVISDLKSDKRIVEIAEPTPAGVRREFVSQKPISLEGFSASDIYLIEQAIDFITPHTASTVSEFTHDSYWEELDNGDEMSVAAAAVWFAPIDNAVIEWAKLELTA